MVLRVGLLLVMVILGQIRAELLNANLCQPFVSALAVALLCTRRLATDIRAMRTKTLGSGILGNKNTTS